VLHIYDSLHFDAPLSPQADRSRFTTKICARSKSEAGQRRAGAEQLLL
jgi:hypothetical protein